MNARLSTLSSSQNPLIQGLSLLIGALLLVGAVVIGAFLLAIAIGVGLVFALVIMSRVWWFKRKLKRSGLADEVTSTPPASAGQVIEAEYTVVDKEPNEH